MSKSVDIKKAPDGDGNHYDTTYCFLKTLFVDIKKAPDGDGNMLNCNIIISEILSRYKESPGWGRKLCDLQSILEKGILVDIKKAPDGDGNYTTFTVLSSYHSRYKESPGWGRK